jgi:hypothetical protein
MKVLRMILKIRQRVTSERVLGKRRIQGRNPRNPEPPPQPLPGESCNMRSQTEPHQVDVPDRYFPTLVEHLEKLPQLVGHHLDVPDRWQIPRERGQLGPVQQDNVEIILATEIGCKVSFYDRSNVFLLEYLRRCRGRSCPETAL